MAKSHRGLCWWYLLESLLNLPLNVTALLGANSSSTGCILPVKSPRVPAGTGDRFPWLVAAVHGRTAPRGADGAGAGC